VVDAIESMLEDFPAYRQADVRFHIGLAEATGTPRLVTAMTEVQGAMTGLIDLIAHPPEVLASANAQHRRILEALHVHDEVAAAKEMIEHVKATEHILAGLMPGEEA
jgi:DNA-binding FadR family transcriptional regulator